MAIAALYIRLSKEDEEKSSRFDESESIKNQRMLLLDYAKAHQYEIYHIYIDEDYSGLYDTMRPAFEQMIQDARKKKFDTVICKSQNRFSRNMEHVEKYLHKEFPLMGIRFIGVVDGTDTFNESGKKARQINGLVNEWYCEDLSENIKAVFQKKMKEGQYLSSFAVFGYKKDPKDHHKIIVDAQAASIVQYIFDLYLSGNGVEKIARVLTEQRVKTPVQYKVEQGLNYKTPNARYSEKGIWSTSTIKRILSNPIYIGTLIQGKERKLSYKEKKVVMLPKEQWHIIENNHEAIIQREVFEQVQKQLSSRRKSAGTWKEKQLKPDAFAGIVVCGDCKLRMYRVPAKQYVYYMCQLYKKSNCALCNRNAIRLDQLEEIILENINRMIANSLTNRQRQSLLRSNRKITISQEESVVRLRKEKDNILRAMSSLYVDYANGTIKEKDKEEVQRLLMESLDLVKKELDEFVMKKETHKEESNQSEYKVNVLNHYLIQSLLSSIEVSVNEENDVIKLVFFWNI